MTHVVARLPAAQRDAFKEPLGAIYETVEPLLEAAGEPVIAVGDVVLAHLGRADFTPQVAVIDGRTEREEVSEWVLAARPEASNERVIENPAGTITADLVRALESALEATEPTRIVVDGEEDLAVVPALLLAPDGATIVYGQPGEGMVAVQVTSSVRRTARELLERMDRDPAFWESRP